MRKPFDRVWYMSENKPIEGMIYFIECYIDHTENPEEDSEIGFYILTNKIKVVYYIVSEYNFKHTSPMDLKDYADVRKEELVFNSRRELVESLMGD